MNELVEMLRSYRLPFGQELELQNSVEEVLQQNGEAYLREHTLRPGDRIDFMVGSIGIECKVDGSPSAVMSQLLRYAESDEVTGLILLTTRSTHRFRITEVLSKPFQLIRISGL